MSLTSTTLTSFTSTIQGGPPIAGASTPIGHTDILISYVYKLAFAGTRGADFGFAAAISIIIFVVVILITLIPVPLHQYVGGGSIR